MNSKRGRWIGVPEDDDRPSLFTTRIRRRGFAMASAAILFLLWADVIVVWNLAPSDTARNVTLTLFGLMLVVFVPLAILVNTAIRGCGRGKERSLDERQLAEQQLAYATAHKASAALMIGVFALVAIGLDTEDQTISVPTAVFSVFAVALVMTHFTLPLLISAWRLPDPLPDDEA
jgi:hypothetical protein